MVSPKVNVHSLARIKKARMILNNKSMQTQTKMQGEKSSQVTKDRHHKAQGEKSSQVKKDRHHKARGEKSSQVKKDRHHKAQGEKSHHRSK